MKSLTLEERVTLLERQLAELKGTMERTIRPKDWRRSVGMFTGDEVMQRIDEAAREYREANRTMARRNAGRTLRAKR